MPRRRRTPLDDLRLAVQRLPPRTRQAMLEALRDGQTIVAGAYTDGRGGACPMLAAHRRGGRTDLLAFARAWDRFTGVTAGRPRPATRRQIRVLEAQLEGALLADEAPGADLRAALDEHRALARARRGREAGELGLDWLAEGAAGAAPAPERPLSPARGSRRRRAAGTPAPG